jgi:23S rRNA pseudouridine1911/1915/1917 synthase
MEKTLSLLVMDDKVARLDTFISEKARLSRTHVQKLISGGMVTLNGSADPRPGSRLKQGDTLHIRIPMEKEATSMEKQDIPISILYEDSHIIVVNKERGMVVHPAPGHHDGTLVNALLYHADEMESVGDDDRPGVVHRLDKNTSGVLIAAKTAEAHQKLVNMFSLRKIKKEYLAVVHGRMKGREGVINLPLGRDPKDRKNMAVVAGGKPSVTRWKLKKAFKSWAFLSVSPETGRTHQIRVHLKYVGNPVVGDPEYAPGMESPSPIEGQALHAWRLSFPHPITGQQMELEAPLPADMEMLLQEMEALSA